MFSSVSGLGRLLNSASATLSSHSTKAQRQYDSVTEETVTYDLLYPEAETSQQVQQQTYPLQPGHPNLVAAAARSADDRGGLNVHASKDIRVIVAQQINEVSRVLYDTHPPTPFSISTSTAHIAEANVGLMENSSGAVLGALGQSRKMQTTAHYPQTSLSHNSQSTFASQPTSHIIANNHRALFSSSKHGGTGIRSVPSDFESPQSRITREEKEETDDLVNCIFGAPGFPSASSTKIHVKRYQPQQSGISRAASPETDQSDSPKPFSPRRTFLSRSTTSEALPSLSTMPLAVSGRRASRLPSSYVLVTRIFSIDPKGFSQKQRTNRQYERCDTVHQSPRESLEARSDQIRTPTFAVALVVYFPSRPGDSTTSVRQGLSMADRGTLLGDSWSSDLGSKVEQLNYEVDLCIDLVVGQWATLFRALANLEVIARCQIMDSLVDLYTPCQSQTRQTLQLESSALQRCGFINEAAESCGKRAALALRIRAVITGQDRWTIWRGVARGIGNPICDREHNHFLFNILTAFLSLHTDWLDLVAPRWYVRRHLKRREYFRRDLEVVSKRTVVVSLDKMAARRMIFLLSIFLPRNYTPLQPGPMQSHWTAPSCDAYSASPPYGASISRRLPPHRTTNVTLQNFPGARAKDFVATEPQGFHDQTKPLHYRRASDARSIRSIALPIVSTATRKNSTTTTATVMPQSEQAIPLLTSFSPEIALGTSAEARPGSSDSMAALRLQRTLSRSESNEHSNSSIESQARDRWSSARSGFWSSRRGSSTDNSDVMASSGEGLGIFGVAKRAPNGASVNRLSQMVEDVSFRQTARQSPELTIDNVTRSSDEVISTSPAKQSRKVSPPMSMPRDSPPEPFPLALSVDEKDGTIDVQHSPGANRFSISSTFTSPRHRYTATSSFDERSALQPPTPGPKLGNIPQTGINANTAGWLRAFHPDFALQAVRPYDALKEDIKQSMRTELESINDEEGNLLDTDGWTTVCTTLLADTATCTITRLTLRRKSACSPHHQADALLGRKSTENTEERFVEETILGHDPTLVEALEPLLSYSSHSSGAPSRAPSPPRSTPQMSEHATTTSGYSRNDCKRVVFGALTTIAKSVAAEIEGEEGHNTYRGTEHDHNTQMPDSVLRQGVRRWMNQAKLAS
ncbi:MAG: hypothetical protein Q9164_001559 [Protoblastenia rupestris]